jgi:hypothetical protein
MVAHSKSDARDSIPDDSMEKTEAKVLDSGRFVFVVNVRYLDCSLALLCMMIDAVATDTTVTSSAGVARRRRLLSLYLSLATFYRSSACVGLRATRVVVIVLHADADQQLPERS